MKLYIADDEMDVREGLKYLIDWEKAKTAKKPCRISFVCSRIWFFWISGCPGSAVWKW